MAHPFIPVFSRVKGPNTNKTRFDALLFGASYWLLWTKSKSMGVQDIPRPEGSCLGYCMVPNFHRSDMWRRCCAILLLNMQHFYWHVLLDCTPIARIRHSELAKTAARRRQQSWSLLVSVGSNWRGFLTCKYGGKVEGSIDSQMATRRMRTGEIGRRTTTVPGKAVWRSWERGRGEGVTSLAHHKTSKGCS